MSDDRSPATDSLTGEAERLAGKLRERTARIGVLGLGYVGLPLAVAFAEQGYPVLGFDVDEEKIAALGRGESYIGAVDDRRLRAVTGEGGFGATADLTRLGETDAALICVPTPLDDNREPDLGYVIRTVDRVAETLRPGQLVVLESTTYPGTTREEVAPRLSSGGLEEGRDFFLAYSPEREDPGNPRYDVRSIPKVVGADDPVSLRLATDLYSRLAPRVVQVSSSAVAEACKLTENIYRAVNIALVNELKRTYDALGIDIWEVLAAAETKPFGFHRFDPGPGWGGHCIPIDPFYLAWRARQAGLSAQFVELAGRINTEMPRWVLGKLEGALAADGKSLDGARVLVLGVAYKENVDDVRESPAFEILDLLHAGGAEGAYHDPHVPELPATRSWPSLAGLRSTPLTAESLAAVDAALVVTAHARIDFELVARHAPRIVDTRGVYPPGTDRVTRG